LNAILIENNNARARRGGGKFRVVSFPVAARVRLFRTVNVRRTSVSVVYRVGPCAINRKLPSSRFSFHRRQPPAVVIHVYFARIRFYHAEETSQKLTVGDTTPNFGRGRPSIRVFDRFIPIEYNGLGGVVRNEIPPLNGVFRFF